MKRYCSGAILLSALAALPAAETVSPAPSVKAWIAAHQQAIMLEYADLVSIPDLNTDRPNIERNAAFLQKMLERHGMASEILQSAGNPVIIGEKTVPGAKRTVLFYIHYDGQPINPSRWKQQDPFEPVLRDGRLEDGGKAIPDFRNLKSFQDDWRLYARGAADDKGPIVAFCTALDASRDRLAGNIRVVLDGEEEGGSERGLMVAIAQHPEKLRADLLIILDGPSHASGRPTLYFGARGGTGLDVTVFGSKFAVHSGHYGNWVPNPAMRLARLLASMQDEQGRTTIEGFYDDVPPFTDAQRRMLRAVPDDEQALMKLFGIARPDAVGESLQEAIQYPSLNVRTLQGGDVGAVIPTEATARIEMRLVKETQPDRMIEKVLAHIRKQGYYIVDRPPDDATRRKYPKIAMVKRTRPGGAEAAQDPQAAWRTEPDSPQAVRVIAALRNAWGTDPVCIRTMGGSVPAAPFVHGLSLPAIGLPTVNFDNNQHSDNENLRLGNLWSGAISIAALMQ